MKTPLFCPKCFEVNPVEYRDDNFYRFECSGCGQKTAAILHKERFEALFDFGSMAFLDGYYREAVANFATALERFFAFYVRTTCRKYEINDKAFNRTWNLMSKQSERQLGAFAAFYLLDTGTSPSFLDPNKLLVKFRNDVVHGGKIPTKEMTVEYADLVYGRMRKLLISLAASAPGLLGKDLEAWNRECESKAMAEGYEYVPLSLDAMFGLHRFYPEAIATEAEKHTRTNLSFEKTLDAREDYLKFCFYRGEVTAGQKSDRHFWWQQRFNG